MESPVASTSKLNRLGNCDSPDCIKPALYRCPACSFPSCSLACSTSHKLAISCSGIASPVWSKQISANEWGWGPLMRDQSYISGVGRLAEETGKHLVGAGLIPKGKAGEDNGVLDERSEKEDNLVSTARSAGVNLVLLPKGMSRRSRNASRWDLKVQRMEWTTEIVFQPPPPPSNILESFSLIFQMSSSKTLHDILKAAMDGRDKKGKGKATENETVWSKVERDCLESLSSATKEEASATKEEVLVVSIDDVVTKKEEATIDDSHQITAESPQLIQPESAFLFLLVATSIPSFSLTTEDSLVLTSVLPTLTPPRPAKPPPKNYYHPSLDETLSSSLIGTTLLEFPTFELWSRESYLRALAKGQLKILPKPEPLAAVVVGSDSWTRGRGRGRGREGSNRGDRRTGGSNPGGGRGGGNARVGNHSSNSNGWNEESHGGERIQDSGWGNKRGIVDGEEGESKRQDTRERSSEGTDLGEKKEEP